MNWIFEKARQILAIRLFSMVENVLIQSNVGPTLQIILCVRECVCMCDTLLSLSRFLYLELWRYIVDSYQRYAYEQYHFHFCFPHANLARFGPFV